MLSPPTASPPGMVLPPAVLHATQHNEPTGCGKKSRTFFSAASRETGTHVRARLRRRQRRAAKTNAKVSSTPTHGATMTPTSFAARVSGKFDAAWPRLVVNATSTADAHHDKRGNLNLSRQTRVFAPHLLVRSADPGRLPPCARRGDSVFWVHLGGLFRSLPLHAAGNLVAFLERSARCWFVVLYTIDYAETRAPWWCRSRIEGRGGQAGVHSCLSAAHDSSMRNVSLEVERAVASLKHHHNGGCAFVVASRSHEPLLTDTATLQNFAAAAAVGRAVLEHHNASVPRRWYHGDGGRDDSGDGRRGRAGGSSGGRAQPRPSDVVLMTRPDIVFNAAVDHARLLRLFSASAMPLLLLLRHDVRDGLETIRNNDPTEVAWLASRSALDRLCPSGQGCLGARRALEVLQHSPAGSCGHVFVTLVCAYSLRDSPHLSTRCHDP